MINTRKYLFAGAILLLLGVFVSSCSKVKPSFNRENIKATWIAPSQNYIYTFDNDYGVTISGAMNLNDGNYKWGTSSTLYYYVYCCSLEMAGSITGFFDIPVTTVIGFKYDIVKHKDSLLIITPTEYIFDSTPVEPGYTELQMNKLPSTYNKADSLLGIWEALTHNDSAYNEFRFQFDASGDMVYYYKDSEGLWTERRVLDDEYDYYNRYSELLALTLYDNSTFGIAEKWAVSCFSIDSVSPSSGILDISSEEFGTYRLKKIE